MAYIPPRPIFAEDPLAYFAALAAPARRPAEAVPAIPVPHASAVEQMIAYYDAD